MINIEDSVLCSIMEHNFVSSDKRIIDKVIDHNIFSDKANILFVKCINRLKELDEPICSDTIRLKLIHAKKWNFYLEDRILQIMISTPFGTYELFNKYYSVLENNKNANDLRESLYI